MSSQLDRNSRYFLYHKDGLLDTFIGFYLLIAGGAVAASMTFLSGGWIAIMVPLWISARKSITMRRVPAHSLPKGTSGRAAAFISVMMGVFALGIAAALVFTNGLDRIPGLRGFLSEYIHLSIGAGISVLLLILAGVLSTGRLALYALAAAAIFLVAHAFAWPFWISMMALGSLMAGCGLIVLTSFIRNNPVAVQ